MHLSRVKFIDELEVDLTHSFQQCECQGSQIWGHICHAHQQQRQKLRDVKPWYFAALNACLDVILTFGSIFVVQPVCYTHKKQLHKTKICHIISEQRKKVDGKEKCVLHPNRFEETHAFENVLVATKKRCNLISDPWKTKKKKMMIMMTRDLTCDLSNGCGVIKCKGFDTWR